MFESFKTDASNKKVIIIGGGDLTAAAYILQNYPKLEQLLVIEIDEKVHEYSKKYILS